MKNKIIALITLIFTIYSVNAQPLKFENSDSAVNLLSSYYNAINQKDYQRAFGYWRSPADSYENFVKAYAETEKVRLIVEPPTVIEGAAGSVYTQIPTVLIATMINGKQQKYAGCYTMQKSNLRPPDIPKEDAWHIYRASLNAAPSEATIPQLLTEACVEETNSSSENKQARVPGMLYSESEQPSGAISAPPAVEVNKEFNITVTTSGNGCVTKGDTSVVLSDAGADVFVYDLTTATQPGIVCTMIFKKLEHTATLKFTKKGEAVIRVWARTQGNSPMGEPVVVEKRVKVR